MGASQSTAPVYLYDAKDYAVAKSGGDEDAVTAATSALLSEQKQKFIRDIAEDFARALGDSELDPEGKSIEEIVKAMEVVFPSHSHVKTGKGFTVKEASQVKACQIMAKIINKHYGQTVVNLASSPENICVKVIEIINSLSKGLSGELYGVHENILRIVKNIENLQVLLDRFHKDIVQKAMSDEKLAPYVSKIEDAHSEVKVELERQKKMLQNILDVSIKPHKENIELLLAQSGKWQDLIMKVKAKPGSKEFSDTVSYAMSTFRSAANIAKLVDTALMELGVKYDEYKKAATPHDLKVLLSNKLQSKLDLPAEELTKLLAMQNFLIANQHRHDEIVENLKTGAGEKKGGLKVDKRVDQAKRLREGLLTAYNRAVVHHFDSFAYAGNKIADLISTGDINVSSKLEHFLKMLELMPSLSNRRIFLSLTGYNTTISAQQERELFISNANNLIAALKTMEEDKKYNKVSIWRDMRAALEAIIETTRAFNKKFTEGGDWNMDKVKSFGKSALEGLKKLPEAVSKGVEAVNTVANAVKDTKDAVKAIGRDEDNIPEEVSGGIDVDCDPKSLPEVTRIGNNFDRTKTIIKYKFRIASMRKDMAAKAKEMPHYSEDYNEVLGKSMSKLVDDATHEQNEVQLAIDGEVQKINNLSLKAIAAYLTESIPATGPGNPDTEDVTKVKRANIKAGLELLREQYGSVKNAFKLVESVDIYMSAFADAIIKHPEALQDIAQILDSMNVSTAWSSEKSGNALCRVFESFPYSYYNTNTNVPLFSNLNTLSDAQISEKKHYYFHVASRLNLAIDDDYTHAGNERLKEISGADNQHSVINGVPDNERPQKLVFNGAKMSSTAANAEIALPGNPFIVMPLETKQFGEFKRNLCDAMDIGTLKNIVSMFISVVDKLGDTKLSKTAPMSPIAIYKELKQYLLSSSYALGVKDAKTDDVCTPAGPGGPAVNVTWTGLAKDIVGVPGVGVNIPLTSPIKHDGIKGTNYEDSKVVVGVPNVSYTPHLQAVGLFMRHVDAPLKDVYNDLFSNSSRYLDQMFITVIKSMVAKIYTSIGVYNAINRPMDSNGLGYYTPLRLILGANETTPKVIPEAMELYVRLPLLAEFYRNIFGLKPETQAAQRYIAMLPEADGIFSGLIDIIFNRAKYVDNGVYSETDARALMVEINRIYVKYGDVRVAVQEFVNEVNRRYGILDKEQTDKYLEYEKSRKWGNVNETVRESLDFELDTLDEDDVTRKPTPSDAYTTETLSVKPGTSKRNSDWNGDRTLVDDFYKKVDKEFVNITGSLSELESKYSFDQLIESKRLELSHAATEADKYRIVMNAMNALNAFASPHMEKSMLLFHELVILPLDTLNQLHQYAVQFKNDIETAADTIKLFTKTYTDFDVMLAAVTGKGANKFTTDNIGPIEQAPSPVNLPAYITGARPANLAAYALAQRGEANKDFTDFMDFLLSTYVDRATVFAKIFNQLFSFVTDELASCNFDSDDKRLTVSLSFSGLRELVVRLVGAVKKNIEKFRGVIPQEIVKDYEDPSKEGSIYYLEENFMNVLLLGKDGTEKTLDALNKNLREVCDYLTRSTFYTHTGVKQAAASAMDFTSHLQVMFLNLVQLPGLPLNDPAFTSSKFYKAVINRSGATMSRNVGGKGNVIAAAPGQPTPTAKVGEPMEYFTNQPTQVYRTYDLSFGFTAQDGLSLLQQFNQLIANYVSVIFDDTTMKVYKTAIEGLFNSALNRAIVDPSAGVLDYDIAPPVVARLYGDFNPIHTNVLVSSLGRTLFHLYNQTNTTGTKVYVTSSASDLPVFTRERMFALLPTIYKMAKAMLKRIEMVKVFSRPLGINSDSRKVLNSTLDLVSQGCVAVCNCIRDTLTELGDKPVYFETKSNFLRDYRALTGKEPFMPPSSITALLGVVAADIATAAGALNFNTRTLIALPIHNVGSDGFKMLYGTRGILSKEHVKTEDFPGLIDIITQHNLRNEHQFHFDTTELDGFMSDLTSGLRFLVDSTKIKKYLTGAVKDEDYNYTNPFKPTLQKTISTNDVIRLTEDTDQRPSFKQIVNHVRGKVDLGMPELGLQNRAKLVAFNIVDMNIVPINIHALRREIPLINLLNYSWVFDHMIADTVGVKSVDTTVTARNGKELLAKMLIDPHAKVGAQEYFTQFGEIVRGDLGIEGLGRPKYIGDELYNKSLFGEIYAFGDKADFTSPASNDAFYKGNKQWQNNFIEAVLIGAEFLTGPDPADAYKNAAGAAGEVGWFDANSTHKEDQKKIVSVLLDYFGGGPIDFAWFNAGQPLEHVVPALYVASQIMAGFYAGKNIDSIAAGQYFVREVNTNVNISNITGTPGNLRATADLPAVAAKADLFPVEVIAKIKALINSGASPVSKRDLTINYENSDSLSFPYDEKGETQIIKIPIKHKALLQTIGYHRFNTKLVRNLVWLTNLQRVIRLELRRQLTWYDTKTVKEHAVTAASITELFGHDLARQVDPTDYKRAPNYRY